MKRRLNFIEINHESVVPKYLQLVNGIIQGLETGRIAKDAVLPSLHDCCVALEISKNSVEKAYNALKNRGIVASYKGKGFYIALNEDKSHGK